MNENTNFKKIIGKLKQNWSLFCVAFLFIAGFLLRLFTVLKNEIQPIDALQYIEIAKAIIGVENNTYIVPREPFFPFLLSLVYLIFPDTFLTARIFTAFIGSATIILIYFVAKTYSQKYSKKGGYEKYGLVSSMLVCFNYNFIANDGNGVRESLFGFLFLLLIYLISVKNKLVKRIFLTVVSFLLILTKVESLILLIGIAFFIYYNENILDNKIMKEIQQNNSENKILDNEETENETKGESNKINERILKYLKTRNYNFMFILLGLSVGFCLWMILSFILFGDSFASSNWMARMYFYNEFNISAPVSLSTFSYLFEYHSFSELALAFYKGFFDIFNTYLTIYGHYLSAFFILTLIFYLFKKDYLSLFWIIYPLFTLGIFVILWSSGNFKRILAPYSLIGIIAIPFFTFEILENFNIFISKKIDIKINKTLLYSLIFIFICLKYLPSIIEVFWL